MLWIAKEMDTFLHLAQLWRRKSGACPQRCQSFSGSPKGWFLPHFTQIIDISGTTGYKRLWAVGKKRKDWMPGEAKNEVPKSLARQRDVDLS